MNDRNSSEVSSRSRPDAERTTGTPSKDLDTLTKSSNHTDVKLQNNCDNAYPALVEEPAEVIIDDTENIMPVLLKENLKTPSKTRSSSPQPAAVVLENVADGGTDSNLMECDEALSEKLVEETGSSEGGADLQLEISNVKSIRASTETNASFIGEVKRETEELDSDFDSDSDDAYDECDYQELEYDEIYSQEELGRHTSVKMNTKRPDASHDSNRPFEPGFTEKQFSVQNENNQEIKSPKLDDKSAVEERVKCDIEKENKKYDRVHKVKPSQKVSSCSKATNRSRQFCGINEQSYTKYEISDSESGKEFFYKCDICGKIASQKSHMLEHVVTHHEKKLLRCKYCSSYFRGRVSMKYHMVNKHPDKQYVCPDLSKFVRGKTVQITSETEKTAS